MISKNEPIRPLIRRLQASGFSVRLNHSGICGVPCLLLYGRKPASPLKLLGHSPIRLAYGLMAMPPEELPLLVALCQGDSSQARVIYMQKFRGLLLHECGDGNIIANIDMVEDMPYRLILPVLVAIMQLRCIGA